MILPNLTIDTIDSDFVKSIGIFYLLIVITYSTPILFTCFQEKFIKQHSLLKLFLSFMFFYFIVTVVSSIGTLEFTPPIEKLIYSIIYFILFLMIMRLDITLSTIMFVCIFIIYFLEVNKEFYLNEDGTLKYLDKKLHSVKDKSTDLKLPIDSFEKYKYIVTLDYPIHIRWFTINDNYINVINKFETVLYVIIVILLILGFISYGGELKETLANKSSITWIDVLLDTRICQLKDKKTFWYYLLNGLSIKL